jgi:hypothetical protein
VSETETHRSKWASRKFVITSAINVISAFALFAGKIEGGDWAMVATASITAYNLANGYAARS